MPKELLVVEDELKFSGALKAFFEQRGFRVATASTAQAALDQWQQFPADVVLLDLKLPDRSGLEVLSQLKGQSPNVRVIVLSGLLDQETIQEAFHRGASEYLTKPVDFDRCFFAAMGLAVVDLSSVRPDPQALQRVPAPFAIQHRILPLRMTPEALELVIADPLDEAHVNELKRLLKCDIKPVAAIGADVLMTIHHWYATEAPAPSTPMTAARSMPSEALLQFINELILQATQDRATDVQMGVGPQGPWMRQRIDGVVYQTPVSAPFALHYHDITAQLKIMASVPLGERPGPQEGRLRFEQGAIRRDLLLSILPTRHGDHLAIRLLEPSQPFAMEQLGLSEEQLKQVNALLAKRGGLVLITGPAGSGKSTTSAAMLSTLNTGQVNMVTVEDVIPYELPGVTQLQVPSRGAFTVAEGLQAALRHDPDIVMVSDLGDPQTVRLVIKAALAGRLVLSTLHTNDATSTIMRLMDMGIEPFLLCSALSGILSQRLLRLLCPHCQELVQTSAATLRTFGVTGTIPSGTLRLQQGRGCARCRTTGYQGRTAIFELLLIDHHIRSLMMKQVSSAQLRQSALCRGMQSLWQSGWRHLLAGRTSLKELLRVLPSPQSSQS